MAKNKSSLRERLSAWVYPLACASALLFGCPKQELAPLSPCTISAVAADIPVTTVDKLDLLFVIDDSGSMDEEQEKLKEQLPDLVSILTSGKRRDGTTFTPVRDLHLAVVTSDMGGSGIKIGDQKCDRNGKATFGRDGLLFKGLEGCADDGADYLSFVPDGEDASLKDTTDKFRCMAKVGIDGCGFEQQLEAMFKALAPDSVRFAAGTRGHGNRENKGFLREDAVLAVIHVSDEEDCSVTDEGRTLFQEDSKNPNVLGPDGKALNLSVRCAYRKDANDPESRAESAGLVHPVERYVDGLKALKPQHPERIVFAAIVGIADGADPNELSDLLDHPKMAYATVDGDRGLEVAPACENPSTNAKPAVRFIKTAQGFGDNGVVQSICADDFAPALNVIIEKIAKQLKGACLPRSLSRTDEGVVDCDVVEVLPAGSSKADCDPERGRKYRTTRDEKGEERVVCDVQQLAVHEKKVGAAPRPLSGVDPMVGWFYDDFTTAATEECVSDRPQRISFSGKNVEPAGTVIRFECFQPVVSGDDAEKGVFAIHSRCESDEECRERSAPSEPLVCDKKRDTCQIACAQDSECPGAWVCGVGEEEEGVRYCVQPTCEHAAQALGDAGTAN